MISGHAGSLTTVHANTPHDAAIRLETLCLMSDVELPQIVARLQVASAIHLVVQIRRFADGSRKVTEIAEAVGLDSRGNIQFRPCFRREESEGVVGDLKFVEHSA
jgi:pilus assembly protein CpaF